MSDVTEVPVSSIYKDAHLEVKKITDWSNEPRLQDLKLDLEGAKPTQKEQVNKINNWLDQMNVTGAAKPKKVEGRSEVQPKLIRRQAEWRYSALSEPFLGSDKLYKVDPVTWEDEQASKQNDILLNYQFRTKLNPVKFIDEYVRTTVDEGTCIVKLGWNREVTEEKQTLPVWEFHEVTSEEEMASVTEAIELRSANPRGFLDLPEDIRTAAEYSLETGKLAMAYAVGTEEVEVEKVLVNEPTVEVLNYKNVFIDPTCDGDINKAGFIIHSFETSKAELIKDGRYKNIKAINWDDSSILATPDHAFTGDANFSFQNKDIRKQVVAYEYWGYYDIHGDDKLVPIVATWVGNVLIRMEENPFPDGKFPFVLVPYMPVKKSVYGEADAVLLEDNQKILGAVTRGMIDLLGRSANGQTGFAKGALDITNKRKYERGDDYEFNPVSQGTELVREHKFPEIPNSALTMLTLQNQEAEALTGVKSFAGGISGEAYGKVAAGIRGMLDAASKREMAILRRLAKGIKEIGQKIISMNAVFLTEEEVVRVTNMEYVVIKREDLAGNFDLLVDISTAEIDEAKSQDLAFMLQTLGANMDHGMRAMILSEIAMLKRMPALAQKIATYQPQPDPLEQKAKELEIAKMELELSEIQSKIELNRAKAKEANSDADLKDLEYVEQETGTKHARDMEKQKGQAKGNQDLEITKALLKDRKPEEKPGDVEAAIGYNQLSDQLDNGSTAPEPERNIGSSYYDPALDPALNQRIGI